MNVIYVPTDLVYLKVQPNKPRSLVEKINEKLSPRFCDPVKVVQKTEQVAPFGLPHFRFQKVSSKNSQQTTITTCTFIRLDGELRVHPAEVLQLRTGHDKQKLLIQR